MVSEKTELNVSLRFPSMFSLRTHFSNGINEKTNPALDEKYIMESDIAAEVLFRRITSEEFAEQRSSRSFWVVPSMVTENNDTNPPTNGESGDVVSKKGTCWSQIKCTGMVAWGVRRQVRFIGRHNEKNPLFSSSNVEEKEDGRSEKEEANEGGVMEEAHRTRKNRKRKRPNSSRIQNGKKAKHEKEKNGGFAHNKAKLFKNSQDRWSAERYKLAEESMLKILKAKGAVFGNPILRLELRQDARKLIGDTGLLDHLLKHMAGKVAPGGTERFRRRHNTEGAMEYWLESADLVDIRRNAGVQDPYWSPPPGWKLGDNPTQDPICAMVLKELKEDVAKMKRDMEKLSKNQEERQVLGSTPNSSVTDNEDLLVLPLKDKYKELTKRKLKLEQQLMQVSQTLSGMEVSNYPACSTPVYEEMEKLAVAMVKGSKKSESEAAAPVVGSTKSPGTEREDEERAEQNKERDKAAAEVGEVGEYEEERGKGQKERATAAATAAAKAAKIQRLKSGFRICKPQGTFLWPNMASPQVLVQLDDLLVVPTPPSVSSSNTTTAATHFLLPPPSVPRHENGTHPPSPVKPLAQRRAVTVDVSTTVIRPTSETRSDDHGSNTASSNTNTPTSHRCKTTTLLDLNHAPTNTENDTGLSATETSSFSTYQRPHHHAVTATITMPCLAGTREEADKKGLTGYCQQQRQRGCSSSPSSGYSHLLFIG